MCNSGSSGPRQSVTVGTITACILVAVPLVMKYNVLEGGIYKSLCCDDLKPVAEPHQAYSEAILAGLSLRNFSYR
jgi:hypothetical protein